MKRQNPQPIRIGQRRVRRRIVSWMPLEERRSVGERKKVLIRKVADRSRVSEGGLGRHATDQHNGTAAGQVRKLCSDGAITQAIARIGRAVLRRRVRCSLDLCVPGGAGKGHRFMMVHDRVGVRRPMRCVPLTMAEACVNAVAQTCRTRGGREQV